MTLPFSLNRSAARHDVLGIGNAIVDVLARVDDAFLTAEGMVKGSMALIDAERAEALYAQVGNASLCSGGSVANTAAGIASLGGRAAYMGRVKDDAFGGVYREDMRRAGVVFDVPAAPEGSPTARSYVCVTPDGERTMNTYLGACGEFTEADIDGEKVKASVITYLEGYLWYQTTARAAIAKATKLAKGAGRHVAFTLSDRFCVENNKDAFLEFLSSADIVFANEEEACALAGTASSEAVAEFFAERVPLAAITHGPAGVMVITQAETIRVPAPPIEQIVDQTGAGDLFAAGFLHGLIQGQSLENCAKLGHACAGEIIGQLGARAQRPLSRLVA